MSTETKALAQRIARALNEPNVEGIELIVEIAGPDLAANIFKKAAELYKRDLKTHDGSRKRTAGGCFFYLAKTSLNREQRLQAGLYNQTEREALNKLEEQGYASTEAATYLLEQVRELPKEEYQALIKRLAAMEE